jgi:predicted Kef-type K+ transport protein
VAFFAGVVVNESDLSHPRSQGSSAAADAFTVLFFVAVGMFIRSVDPRPATASGVCSACIYRDWKDR